MDLKEIIISYFSDGIKTQLNKIDSSLFSNIQEIRIRAEKPLIVKCGGRELSYSANKYIATQRDIQKTLESMSNFSLYALEEEMRQGYITLEGGHRVGITGKIISNPENGGIKAYKYINGLNIRISHEIKGCAEKIKSSILCPGPVHMMIISPPGCGKTTLLRDLIRISSNSGYTVGVVDERSEIGGCFRGIPQNDLGIRTDILDSCPKSEGMTRLLRAMSPDIIAVDEIGSNKDVYAIEETVNAGVKIFCTVHGSSLRDIENRSSFKALSEVFERYVVMSGKNGPGHIEAIYNKNKEAVYDT